MNLPVHQKALDMIAFSLTSDGYRNQTAAIATYGINADVVGKAFSLWSDLDTIAAFYQYRYAEKCHAADKALKAFETIEKLARELMPVMPARFEVSAQELADYDTTMDDASNRGGLM